MQQISVCLWASATIFRLTNQFDPEMVHALNKQILNKQDQFNVRNVPISLWALGVFELYNEKVLNLFCETIPQQIQKYSPQNISNLLWAFANLGFYDKKTLDLLCYRILSMLDRFLNYEVTMCMYALARLDYQDEQLIKRLIEYFDVQKINELQSWEISNLLWSISIFNIRNNDLTGFERILSNILERINQLQFEDEFAYTGLFQIYQSKLLCENQEVLEKIWRKLNKKIFLQAQNTWKKGRKEFMATKLDRELSQQIKKINIGKVIKEYTDPKGFFRIDAAVFAQKQNFISNNDNIVNLQNNKNDDLFNQNGSVEYQSNQIDSNDFDIRIAFEADGPSHFTRNKPHLMMGDMLARNKMLEIFGWKVISVPFYEWDFLQEDQQQQYLIQKLAEIGLCFQNK
eukprot:TRINITY_DN6370_c0_g1_i1.p1 TRINITY_DN6370_c0_g1~~TRINITY_DN6370_c0_g1_i1.p1  ORF type:complete len:401 (-),score=41.21 TRINITY_DN6370_c0_g1_i1:300-1502(-)